MVSISITPGTPATAEQPTDHGFTPSHTPLNGESRLMTVSTATPFSPLIKNALSGLLHLKLKAITKQAHTAAQTYRAICTINHPLYDNMPIKA